MVSLRSLYNTEFAVGAYSKSITTAFTIPAVGETGTQKFDTVEWVSIGHSVFFSDDTNYAYLTVTGVNRTTDVLTLENTNGDTVGSEIAITGRLSPSGKKGIQGPQGDVGPKGDPGDSTNLTPAEIKTLYENNDDTNAFTDVEKTALSTAIQPADLTLYAPLNDPVFTGTELKLPNNSRINGVEHFYQSTKPTVRGDSSALQVGDLWWKTADGDWPGTGLKWWTWNGSYWAGSSLFLGLAGSRANGSGVVNDIVDNWNTLPPWYPSLPANSPVLIIKNLTLYLHCDTADVSNFWSYNLRQTSQSGATTPSTVLGSTFTLNVSGTSRINHQLNLVRQIGSFVTGRTIGLFVSATGSPASIVFTGSVEYSFIHP